MRKSSKKAIYLAKYLLLGPQRERECVNFIFSAAIHRWAGSDCLPAS